MSETLRKTCDRFRRGMRGLLLRLAVSRTFIALVLLLAASVAVDWYFRFDAPGRWLLLGTFALAAVAVALHEFSWLRRRAWTDLEVLRYLDAADPAGHDRLVGLHELARPEGVGESVTAEGLAVIEHALRELAAETEEAGVPDPLRRERVRRWQRAAVGMLVAVILVSLTTYSTVSTGLTRLFLPFAEVRWPTLTTLEVVEPDTGWRMPQGESFTVVTNVLGARPAEIEIVYRAETSDYWITEHVPVDGDGRAVHTLEDVAEPVTFYLRGGDDRTRRFTVDVIEKPRITRIVATYTYPPYAGIPPRRIDSGQIRGLEGTRVKIDFECSVPLRVAVWAIEGGAEETLALTSPTTFSKSFQLSTDACYVLKLTDVHGFREYRPERYEIQVTPDEPPAVRLLSPGADLVATHQAKPRFIFEATDDFGLTGVTFMHEVRPGGEAGPLTDRITGPVGQTGKESRAEFDWDFAKMGLAESVEIECWVVAKDCNPTGRGVSETQHRRISVLKPTDFHLRILYEARKVLAEARVAYRSQKEAYHLGLDWTAKPADGTDDERWREVVARQDLARRATDAVRTWLDELSGHIERNRMEDAFMKNRLAVIEELQSGAAQELSAAVTLLGKAHPRNAAEAEPARLRTTRLDALKRASDRQKLATVGLGRLLRKMYDWENLQTALVNTQLLRERQTEIYETTRTIAPVTIGREAEDLDEKTLDKVLVLAQQQNAVMEAETSLETQLASIALKASAEGRRSVSGVLLTAYGYLRDIQVGRSLKQIARKIAANQLSDVSGEQLEVVTAMKVVEGGLVKAGRDVESEEPVNVADLLKREDADVETARVEAPEETGEEAALRVDEAAVRKLLEEVVPMAEDDLSQGLVRLAEDQDSVRSRTAYLAGTVRDDDMPRYRRLKMGMLDFRQGEVADYAAGKLATLAAGSEHAQRAKPVVQTLAADARATRELLAAGDVSETCRGLQSGIIDTARDVAQFIARQKQVRTLAAEHEAKGGVDDFNRAFVLKGDDLARALDVYTRLDWCRTRQKIVARRAAWLGQLAAAETTEPVLKRIVGRIRSETVREQQAVADEVRALKAGDVFSDEVKPKVEATGLADVPDDALKAASSAIAAGKIDAALGDDQEKAAETMRLVLRRLKDLMDERVAVLESGTEPGPTEVATTEVTPGPEEKVYVTEEEVAKESTPEAIRVDLATSERITPEMRERMLKHLPQVFPEKYRRLVGAYYRTLLDAPAGGAKEQTP